MNKTLHHIGVGIISLFGLVLLNVGFLFLLLSALPTVIAYFLDETPKMDLYKTVRATNLAGMLPTLASLLHSSNPDASLQIAMGNPDTWVMVYGAAAIGWVLIWLCRWVAYLSIMAAGEGRIITLEKAQKELVAEWGDDLKEYVISTQ